MGLKILGRVGTHFFIIIFSGKSLILCIMKSEMPFKMHKIIFFSRNLKNNLGFISEFRQGRATLNKCVRVFIWP